MMPAILLTLFLSKVFLEFTQPAEENILKFPKLEEEIARLKVTHIYLFDPNNRAMLKEVVSELSAKGVVPLRYYQALLEFALLWFFIATLFITTIALVYYRKFKQV